MQSGLVHSMSVYEQARAMHASPATNMYRLDAEVEETTLFREPRALGCRRPERQRGRY